MVLCQLRKAKCRSIQGGARISVKIAPCAAENDFVISNEVCGVVRDENVSGTTCHPRRAKLGSSGCKYPPTFPRQFFFISRLASSKSSKRVKWTVGCINSPIQGSLVTIALLCYIEVHRVRERTTNIRPTSHVWTPYAPNLTEPASAGAPERSARLELNA